MRIGVPRELKDQEHRVALTPAGVQELVLSGHEVFVERVTLPYVRQLANLGWRDALRADPGPGSRSQHPRRTAHQRPRR